MKANQTLDTQRNLEMITEMLTNVWIPSLTLDLIFFVIHGSAALMYYQHWKISSRVKNSH